MRIVLIEDNDGDVYLIERALAATRRPFEISRYKDGAEALRVLLVAQQTTPPDLILLDLNMPRCDGLEILRRIRSSPNLTAVPVGILTGSVTASDRQIASTIGATRYIHKASHYDAFVSNVSNAVEEMLDEQDLRNNPHQTPDFRPIATGKTV
jgi:CheY-like chemotaxis protein